MSGAQLEEDCGSWEMFGEATGAGGHHIATLFLVVGRETPRPSPPSSQPLGSCAYPSRTSTDGCAHRIIALASPRWAGLGHLLGQNKKTWGPSPWVLKGTSKAFFGGGEGVWGGRQ